MEWISVKDRLPEKSGPYLVFGSYKGTTYNTRLVFTLSDTWNWGNNIDDNWDDAITHWMPLPDPPKAEPRWWKDGYGYIHDREREEKGYVPGQLICNALNGTAEELLEFAGVECEYDTNNAHCGQTKRE